MKLLDSTKKAVAVLDEGTTKLCYYGKDPALIYFTATKTAKVCVVKKVEGLAGWFIETDAGNVVALTGSLENMINTLETVLGTKIGYFESTGAGNTLPEKTVDFYKEKDEDDSEIITITVIVDGEDEPRVFEFTRGPNAVKVKDVLAKLGDVEGLTGLADADGNVLGKKNKLLEDQELTAVIEEPTGDGEGDGQGGDDGQEEGGEGNTDNPPAGEGDDTPDTEPTNGEPVNDGNTEGDENPDPDTEPTGDDVEGNETDSDNV